MIVLNQTSCIKIVAPVSFLKVIIQFMSELVPCRFDIADVFTFHIILLEHVSRVRSMNVLIRN